MATTTKTITLEIKVVEMANGNVALMSIGGIELRSSYDANPEQSVKQLLNQVVNNVGDAGLGLALALEGTWIADQLTDAPALAKGRGKA